MSYFLSFTINDVPLAAPIEEVREIARPKSMLIKHKTNIRYLVGHFKLRGVRIPLYDLPDHLSLQHSEEHEVIVTEFNSVGIGIWVDKVHGIIESEELLPYPAVVVPKKFLKGIVIQKDVLVQVMSFHKLFTARRLKSIQAYLEKQTL